MNANDVASEGLGLISRLADEARSVAVVAGYVALGAAVLVGRSLLEAAGETWRRVVARTEAARTGDAKARSSVGGSRRSRGRAILPTPWLASRRPSP